MSLSQMIRSRSRSRSRQLPVQYYKGPAELVKEKLEKYYDTSSTEQQKLELLSEQLTDVDQIEVGYLGSLLTASKKATKDWEREHSFEKSFENVRTYRTAAKKVGKHFKEIAKLDVKLYLTDINHSMSMNIFGRAIVGTLAKLLKISYGPLHAALKVGNVYLEWGDSSLVIPTELDDTQQIQLIRFAGEVQQHGTFYKQAQELKEMVRDTIPRDHKKMKFTRQREIAHDLGEHRERIIHQLAEVIADYNSNKKYSIFHCNCQHFVEDCLTALEINDQPEFPHEMQTQLKRLKRGGMASPTLERRRFGTHTDLDKYYLNEDKMFKKEDLEYISLLYYHFHLTALIQAGKPEDWHCQEDDCQLDAVQEKLQQLCEEAEELEITVSIRSTAL